MKIIGDNKNIREILSFGIIGVLNTLLGTAVMFGLYNLLGVDYWISSAANYVIGSIFSFFMNKRFTFKVKNNDKGYIIRFIIIILLCYLLAYGLAKKGVSLALANTPNMSLQAKDNISMAVGMVLFVVLNYCGQKFFVFRKEAEEKGDAKE